MDFNDDEHLDDCQNIEFSLTREYDQNPSLTDSQCILALDSAKVAVKQHFGFAQNESFSRAPEIQGIIERCVTIATQRVGLINDLTLNDYVNRLEKIKHSVQRHLGTHPRSYYQFIEGTSNKSFLGLQC